MIHLEIIPLQVKKQKVVPSIDDADLGYDDQEMMGKDGGKEWDVMHF